YSGKTYHSSHTLFAIKPITSIFAFKSSVSRSPYKFRTVRSNTRFSYEYYRSYKFLDIIP
ncbi:hypothetical protein COW06_02655, partial [Candidatus Gracilibacteria bacterium CG12_big_fil_rev_8_21_14_0_65_38_15]